MFGLLRITFALMVMVYHLFLGVPPLGIYAVFGFYIISGYLMTLIMHESYGYTLIGRYSFAVNRLLRLYPQYWAAAFLSIVLVINFGTEATTGFHESIYLPFSIKDILQNFFMSFIAWFPNTIKPRLVPPSWALTVEIFFYLLICLGISKTLFRVKIWLFCSFCYVIFSYISGWDWSTRYFPVAAAALPFSIGAAIYFASKNKLIIEKFIKLRLSAKKLFILMMLNCLTCIIISITRPCFLIEIEFYINISICTLLVYSLSIKMYILNINKKYDKIIGDYSYPIYLIHWQIGLLSSHLIYRESFHEFSKRGFVVLIVSFFIATLLSTFFIRRIDYPIQNIRTRIKINKALQQTLVSCTTEDS